MKGKWFSGILGRLKSEQLAGRAIILSVGALIAQVIPVLISPILSRVYTQEEFGEFTLFVSAVNIIGQIICLKYDMAITVTENKDEGARLFCSCVIISVILSILLMGAYPFIRGIAEFFGTSGTIWIWMIPPACFLTGIYTALVNYNISLHQYKDSSVSNVVKSISSAVMQVGGFVLGTAGLVLGQMVSFFMGNARLMKHLPNKWWIYFKDIESQKKTLYKFRKYPAYMAAGSFINTCTYNYQSFALSSIYSSAQVGGYGLVNRILATPITIISTSIGQALLRQASEEYKEKGTMPSVTKFAKYLWVLSLGGFSILFLIATPLIVFVFGEQWREAAEFLKILIPLYAARFAAVPIINTAIVLDKQRAMMVWQITMFLLSVVPLWAHAVFSISIHLFLLLTSILLTSGYIIFEGYCLYILKQKEKLGKNE